MGVNLCVSTLRFKEHPDWDSGRFAGDTDFVMMMHDLPHECAGDEKEYVRPTNFSAWREAVAKIDWPNPKRIPSLIDLLEQNPDYWIYASW